MTDTAFYQTDSGCEAYEQTCCSSDRFMRVVKLSLCVNSNFLEQCLNCTKQAREAVPRIGFTKIVATALTVLYGLVRLPNTKPCSVAAPARDNKHETNAVHSTNHRLYERTTDELPDQTTDRQRPCMLLLLLGIWFGMTSLPRGLLFLLLLLLVLLPRRVLAQPAHPATNPYQGAGEPVQSKTP